jgi:hypothetical protein
MDDLADLPALAAKLKQDNPLARHLSGRLSDETRKRLAAYEGGVDGKLGEALVQDLNTVVLGPPIYDEDLFRQVERRPETQQLLALNPEGEELARLNRLLLQDAYPVELSRPKQVEVS